jgi:glutaminyl-peptide cyclotransferase
VPCVHVIAIPFPSVWHTEKDNASAVSGEVGVDMARIFRTFVLEYLGI